MRRCFFSRALAALSTTTTATHRTSGLFHKPLGLAKPTSFIHPLYFSTDSQHKSSYQGDQDNDAVVAQSSKMYADYTIYKGTAAMSLSPGRPLFKRLENSIILKKEDCVFMSYARAVAAKEYDWTNKQTFALSVKELAGLIALEPTCTFTIFHDPNVGTSDAGKVKKAFKVEPFPDMSGFYFKLGVVDTLANVDERFSVPVTSAEFAVIKSAFSFIIPYLMGWHAVAVCPSNLQDFIEQKIDKKAEGSLLEGDPDLEWAK